MMKAGEYFYILPATQSAAEEACESLSGSGFAWLYIGENMDRRQEIERTIGGRGEFLHIGSDLRETASRLRGAYIEYIGSLAPSDPQSDWWTGVLSEKNPYISKTFINICFADIAANREKFASHEKQPTAMFVENETLRCMLLKRRGIDGCDQINEPGYEEASGLRQKISLARWIISRRSAAIKAFPKKHTINLSEPVTLIFTFVFPSDFSADGKLSNHHLGNLEEHLQNNGENTALWPYVLNDSPEERQWEKLAASHAAVLPCETYISAYDALKNSLSYTALSKSDIERKFPPFLGEDITPLLRMDMATQLTDNRYANVKLLFSAVEEWKKAGVKIRKVIYPFENHFWERTLCAAMSMHYPDALLIGSQHASLPKMLINYFIASEEAKTMPLPDRVVAIGKTATDILKNAGYPQDMIVEGAGFRFQSILTKTRAARGGGSKNSRPLIVVACSIERSVSIELIDACAKACALLPDIDIVAKCHPGTKFEALFPNGRELPSNMTITNENMDALLDKADALVYAVTSACLEAMLLEIPVVHFTTQSMLDIDPLEDAPNFKRDASSPEEIAETIKAYLSGSIKPGGTSEERFEFIRNFFNPVNSDTIAPYFETGTKRK